MGNPLTKAVGNILTTLMGNVLTEQVGKVLDIYKLGGVPRRHRTDRLSAAVHKECNPEEFTQRYQALLRHYGIKGDKIRSGEPHENGDIKHGNSKLNS